MGSRRPPISQTELQVLRVLWEHGPGTVRDVDAILRRQRRRWAYTTVLTLLHRLQAKGYVASDKSELAHVFRAAVTREDLIKQRLVDLADQLCEGTASPLVHALVGEGQFSAEEIESFRKLLDEAEGRQRKGQSRGRARS
ncbi:MAG: BlaI/MecI/CopY family transcriptional regulator [Planctomycetes bacterium]|nr:BlaI/MecI/CopY family transcriptional regulator [Planctomycetota bacterium]